MSVRVSLQPAFVLHTRPYRDTSMLVELLTYRHGRVCAVARGARQPRSRFKALLRPFCAILVSWTGAGDLVTLTQAEQTGVHTDLQGGSLVCGMYLNELLVRLLGRHDPCVSLFNHYQKTMVALLAKVDQCALRLFELQLLEVVGYGINFDEVAHSGEPIEPEGWYQYRVGQGFVPVLDVLQGGVKLRGEDLLAIADRQLTSMAILKAAKYVTRMALASLLGGRPLKSRELLVATPFEEE